MGIILNILLTLLILYIAGKLLVLALRWYLMSKLQSAGANFAGNMFNQGFANQSASTSQKKYNKPKQENVNSTLNENNSDEMVECSKCSTFIVKSQTSIIDGNIICSKCY